LSTVNFESIGHVEQMPLAQQRGRRGTSREGRAQG
jgi:hypothetical protein